MFIRMTKLLFIFLYQGIADDSQAVASRGHRVSLEEFHLLQVVRGKTLAGAMTNYPP